MRTLSKSALATAFTFLTFSACGGGSPTSPTPTTTTTTTLPAIWSQSGTGDSVFNMPGRVARVRVIGTYTAHSSNFIVWIDKPRTLLVNELLGTGWSRTTYDGTLLTQGGGVVSIESSSGVVWSFTEVR